MQVLGIDLAASPKKTAACVLEGLEATIHLGLDDRALLDLAHGAAKVGIDAPFGWPRPFVEALVAHRCREAWPAPDDGDPGDYRRTLTYRATDLAILHVRRPLSVSTDRLGVTAMRCVHLLQRWSVHEPVDRSGVTGRFAEVYPAGALTRWGIPPERYKGHTGVQARRAMLLRLPVSVDEDVVLDSDDAFDALVAALVARAIVLGLTDGPPAQLRELAEEEGWIHLPQPGSLERLSQ